MRPSLSLCLLAAGLPAFAWGPEGHSLVARMADAQLTPAARARVVEILGAGKSMASVASWADEIRRSRADTGPWHYVDIPVEKSHLDMQRDCANGACIVSALARFRQAMNDSAATPDQRREALMFVIHFIGDMHQPLHSSERNHDKGGNDVKILFHDRNTNLHSLWDSGLLGRLAPEEQLFPALSTESARRRKKYSRGNVTSWAEESHKEAKKFVYGKLPKAPEGQVIAIPAEYEAAAAPLLRKQLERAGARLAYVLNTELK